ncbi:MAG: FAD-dependent monooxygenase [Hyphomicrobiaceae bacterium]|nr:FAD-dependent monooxygenase [Hyphomicrobiaceae bacterium]
MALRSKGPALIVGGGIGGLTLALALARRGWRSCVLERRSAWSEAGAGIQLSPNALQVLRALDVAETLGPQAGVPEKIMVRDAASARLLQELPLGSWIEQRHGAPYWQVHRRDLQAALIARVAEEPMVTVHLGFEASSVQDNGQRVQLESTHGDRLEGTFVVGADGIFSRVRQQSLGAARPRLSGWTAARTVLSSDELDDGVIDRGATGVWLAPKAHVVHYPVRAGREIAFVVVQTEAWSEPGWSAPVPAGNIEAVLARAAPKLARAIRSGHGWRRWALFELAPLERWSRGRITVLGDAAHPTLPFLAQGGALAIEDAWTMAFCIGQLVPSCSIADALVNYQMLRARRARQVVAAARRNGFVFHLAGPAAWARNATMRAIGGARVMAGYDWVYGWRPA